MTILSVSGIAKSYGGVRAVDDVSFDVGAGELVALIGPNGAGKSTCFNMLNGQIVPDSGSILLNGQSIHGLAPRDIWKRGVGRTFQVAEVYGSMTVSENVQMVLMSRNRRFFDLRHRARDLYRDEALVLLQRVGMESQADRLASILAYGDVKRLELAIAIANVPTLLLMDEPAAGMAPHERNELMALTAALVRERNLAVLFTEHSMDVVFSYAHRIMVLSRGKLIAAGSPVEIRDNAQVQDVYLGTSKILNVLPTAAA